MNNSAFQNRRANLLKRSLNSFLKHRLCTSEFCALTGKYLLSASTKFPPLTWTILSNCNSNHIWKYTCINSIPTSTHQFPARNHRPTGLQYTVKCRIPNMGHTSSSRYVIGSQPLQDVAMLSTVDNTFHICGICLNWNHKVYSLSKSEQSDFQIGKLIYLTFEMILWFLKSHLMTFGFTCFQGCKYSLLPSLFHNQGN